MRPLIPLLLAALLVAWAPVPQAAPRPLLPYSGTAGMTLLPDTSTAR